MSLIGNCVALERKNNQLNKQTWYLESTTLESPKTSEATIIYAPESDTYFLSTLYPHLSNRTILSTT